MHVSELGKKNTSAFRRGNTIKAVVANLDHEKQRFSLKPLDAKMATDEQADKKLDAIEQFKLNTESEEEMLVLDTESQTSEIKTTSSDAPLEIGYNESSEDAEYGQVFSTSSSTSSEPEQALQSDEDLANFTEEEVSLYRLIASVQNGEQNIISLNDLYQEFAKKHANQGNLQDFKLLIKQGHENGWLKLLRHSEDKGLYVQLHNQGDEDQSLELN